MAAPQAPRDAMRPGSEGATATECRKCRPEWPAHINRDTRIATHQWIVERSTGSQSKGLRVFDPEYHSLHPPYDELVAIIRPATATNKEPRPARHRAHSISASLHRHVGINRCASAGISSPALASAAACRRHLTARPRKRRTSAVESAAGRSRALTQSGDRRGSAACRHAACRHRLPHVRRGHGASRVASRQANRG